MSARDRLIDAGMKHIASYELELGVNIPGWRTLSRSTLDAFLARPDDLLAVMVEAGVLEPAGEQTFYKPGDYNPSSAPVYRRRKGTP